MLKHYAEFTQVFGDIMQTYPNILDDLVLDTDEHTKKMKEMILAKYYNYEISGETYGAFKEMLVNRFNQYKDYYIEFINAYETKINMLDGRVTTRLVTENRTRDSSGESKGNNESKETYIDLPRTDSTQERPTSKTSTISTPTSSYTDNRSDDINRNATIKGVDTQVDLKKKYLALIKNVYIEFVDVLKPCFLTLYY